MRSSLAGLVALILIVGSLPAAASVDIGYDPDETDVTHMDIRSSVLRVEDGRNGRFLKVAARIFEEEDPIYWGFTVRLDARGGRSADAVIDMEREDISGSGCRLETRSGRRLKDGVFRLSLNGLKVSCRVPLHPFHPTKAIRGKVISFSGLPGSDVSDVAPNRGMYG